LLSRHICWARLVPVLAGFSQISICIIIVEFYVNFCNWPYLQPAGVY
jgi:hypothetical protein